jgi:hypothetical protein
MRKLTFTIFVLGIILSLQCCASSDKKISEPKGVLLTQNELEKLFNEEITLIISGGIKTKNRENSGQITCYPNGTQNMIWVDGGEPFYGTYRIINGKKCDDENCWKFYKISDKKYYLESDEGSGFLYITVK